MKYLLLLLPVAFACTKCYSQKITGFAIDKTTGEPVSGALVNWGNAKTFTGKSGRFELTLQPANDSLKIVHSAYKPYATPVSRAVITLHIELEPAIVMLHSVTVRGSSDFKKDSIENRIAYAKQFNYKAPTVMDALSGNPNKGPGELISINPLILIAVLTTKSSPDYKFHKALINDEHEAFVDRKFNRGVVSRITGLKSDTLAEFLTRYRPAYNFAKKATDYDMEIYIKENFKKFEKEGVEGSNPFHNISNKNGQQVKLN